MRDLATALRSLRRAPAFSALVVLTLALGVGATTAMFSVVDAVLINPLPFPDAGRLADVRLLYEKDASRQVPQPHVLVRAVRSEPALFAAVEAYAVTAVTLTGVGDAARLSFPAISAGLPATLGIAPLVGRLFTEDEAAAGERVVLISERFWTSRFGRDPTILGRRVVLDDVAFEIVGVMPRTFVFPFATADLWQPLDVSASAGLARITMATRLRPGVSLAQADHRLSLLSAALRAEGSLGRGQSLDAEVPLQLQSGRQGVGVLWLLFAAVGLVLLVACVNVCSLLLVRASARHAEFALKSALGAGKSTLLRIACVESVVLSATGAGSGIGVAKALMELVLRFAPPQMSLLGRASTELDARALGFAIALAFASCLLSGVLPAWRASRVDAIDALKRASAFAGSRDDRWQGAMVTAQLALVVVLLAGAGAMLRSFVRLTAVDLGFDPGRLAVVDLQIPQRYASAEAAAAFVRQVEERAEARLGLQVAITSAMPVRSGGYDMDAQPEAEGRPSASRQVALPVARVSTDYFATLGIPIVEGRSFSAGDGAEAIVINEVIARRYWGDTSPIGRRFRTDPDQPWQTVVGVVRDVKTMGPADAIGEGAELYLPFSRGRRAPFVALLIATRGDPAIAVQQVKQVIAQLDRGVPITFAGTMAEWVGISVARPRFVLILSSVFAATAVWLSAIGVYGVSAYWVSRRRRELAIRAALGASRPVLAAMVFRRSLRLALAGSAIGLAAALGIGRLLETWLFATSPGDPQTLAAVTTVLALLVVAACSVPAVRAGRVDPVSDLRRE